jgi:hypothetical protein
MRSPEISAERIRMPTAVERRTVDLSRFPKLVVIYLGMRVNRIRGFRMLVGFGPKISNSAAAAPDGLLLHEQVIYSTFPLHVGMRQYWRDLESLLAWTGSEPHRTWTVFHRCDEEVLRRAQFRLRRQAAQLGFQVIPLQNG